MSPVPPPRMVDAPCSSCASTLFFVDSIHRQCPICRDRETRLAQMTRRDGPMTPPKTTTTTEKETP